MLNRTGMSEYPLSANHHRHAIQRSATKSRPVTRSTAPTDNRLSLALAQLLGPVTELNALPETPPRDDQVALDVLFPLVPC